MPDEKKTPKYMDLKEFIELGYLQEINRLVLHPCGLALQMTLDTDDDNIKDGQIECKMQIWDDREDPEGTMFFHPPSREKAMSVDKERIKHYPARFEMFEHLDHNNESFSVSVVHPEHYGRTSFDGMLQVCHPPDIQPATG